MNLTWNICVCTDKYKGEYCQDEITIEDRLNTPVKITIGYTASRIRNLYNFELNVIDFSERINIEVINLPNEVKIIGPIEWNLELNRTIEFQMAVVNNFSKDFSLELKVRVDKLNTVNSLVMTGNFAYEFPITLESFTTQLNVQLKFQCYNFTNPNSSNKISITHETLLLNDTISIEILNLPSYIGTTVVRIDENTTDIDIVSMQDFDFINFEIELYFNKYSIDSSFHKFDVLYEKCIFLFTTNSLTASHSIHAQSNTTRQINSTSTVFNSANISTLTIILISIGLLIFLFTIFILVWCCCCKTKREIERTEYMPLRLI